MIGRFEKVDCADRLIGSRIIERERDWNGMVESIRGINKVISHTGKLCGNPRNSQAE
jgi:hypothetical protein